MKDVTLFYASRRNVLGGFRSIFLAGNSTIARLANVTAAQIATTEAVFDGDLQVKKVQNFEAIYLRSSGGMI